MMARAFDVAKCLIHLAATEDEPDFLTHLRLQKLLYYVQGWSLTLRKKAMFPEEIQAWAHGPVVVSVYPKFADFGNGPIDPTKVGRHENVTKTEAEFIAQVWDAYKGYSASSLREMTHREAPWRDARAGYRPADACKEVISHSAMRRFFSKYVDK
jgi:uncharacterized phage-associated protein